MYAFFNNLTLAYNGPPALVNSEVRTDLPCGEYEWASRTSESWSELRKHSSTPTPTFLTMLRSLLSPQGVQPLQCSTFGSYLMIHALLQQIWHIRQASLTDGGPHDLSKVGFALRKWQVVWQRIAESVPSPQDPYRPLAFNSTSLLRLAHIMLCVDFATVKSVVASQNVNAISQSMKTHMSEVERSADSTKAALYAIHALRIPVKLGINLVARAGSLVWSLQHYLHSFECCKHIMCCNRGGID